MVSSTTSSSVSTSSVSSLELLTVALEPVAAAAAEPDVPEAAVCAFGAAAVEA